MKATMVLIGLAVAGSLISACDRAEVTPIANVSTPPTESTLTGDSREGSPGPKPTEDVPAEGPTETATPAARVTPGATATRETDTPVPPTSTPVPDESQSLSCTPKTDWPAYTVKRGETLGEIAIWSGAPLAQLLEANCLVNPDSLLAGQVLRVPRLPSEGTLSSPPTPVDVWRTYSSSRFRISIDFPAAWEPAGEGQQERFEGADGWLELGSLGSPWSLDEVVRSVSQFDLLPFDREPSFERLTLDDGRPARIIFPSEDQPEPTNVQARLVAPYAGLVEIGGERHNYFILKADADHIRQIARSLSMPPAPNNIGVAFFRADVVDLADGGKRITFRWDSFGATRGAIYSGTAERFIPWWPVEASGELTVELAGTIFPDPQMTLEVVNEASQAEANTSIVVEWPCTHDYFFSPAPDRCPSAAPLVTDGAFQPFERGFMIWLPAHDFVDAFIYVFFDDGRVRAFSDQWSAESPDVEPDLAPPDGLFQPVRGFGLAWREEPGLRETLGWATAPESSYEVTYQSQIRESIPGVYYLTAPDGRILHVIGQNWSELVAD